MIKNLRLAYIIGIPAFVTAITLLLLIYGYDMKHLGPWLVFPVLMLVVLYVSQTQIQWWYSKRNPPDLHKNEKQILSNFSYIYPMLEGEEKKRYEDRISLFRLTRHIRLIDKKDVPEDVKLLICLPAVEMTFYEEETFKGKYQQIVVYPHPFLSPQHGDQVHITEIEHKDGTMVFSVEQLLPGLERKMFNIVAYEWAQAYLFVYERNAIVRAVDKEEVKENLKVVIGLDFPQLVNLIGLEDVDIHAVALSLFIDRPSLMIESMPRTYKNLKAFFEKRNRRFMEGNTA